MCPKERYEYVKAVVDCGGLSWRYRLVGATIEGSDSFDQDVSDWDEDDIRAATMSYLGMDDDERELIQIEYV